MSQSQFESSLNRRHSQLDVPFDQLCEMKPGRAGEDSQYWLDSTAIKTDLGWEQRISLEEGLREMVDWGRKYLALLRDDPKHYVLRA